jgi:hypothetical protein
MTNASSRTVSFSRFLILVSFVIVFSCVSLAKISGAENGEVDDGDDTQSEQKCVSLQIPDLNQSQQRPNSPGSAATSIDYGSINDPSIKETCDAREQFLCPVDQPGVKLVEIKLVA